MTYGLCCQLPMLHACCGMQIHAWQADFSDMVHTVSDKLDPPALPNQPPPPPVDAAKIYVWWVLHLLAGAWRIVGAEQRGCAAVGVLHCPASPLSRPCTHSFLTLLLPPFPLPLPHHHHCLRPFRIDFAAMPQGPNHGQSLLESGAVREIISSCKGGSLVVLDPELLVLRRAWCLMEVFLSVYTHQQDRLQVLFPGKGTIDKRPVRYRSGEASWVAAAWPRS